MRKKTTGVSLWMEALRGRVPCMSLRGAKRRGNLIMRLLHAFGIRNDGNAKTKDKHGLNFRQDKTLRL